MEIVLTVVLLGEPLEFLEQNRHAVLELVPKQAIELPVPQGVVFSVNCELLQKLIIFFGQLKVTKINRTFENRK